MRIVTNETHINSRTRWGERAPLAGLLLLAAATLLIFWRPDLIWATTVVVSLGFIVSLIGSYLGDRYVGPLAHHKKVPEALKGLDNDYVLLMYKTPFPFVLVSPGGVTVITVKSQGGDIAYVKGRWKHREKLGWLRRFAGQEGLGRPDRLAQAEADDFRNFLAKRLPEGMDVPVRPAILFINSNIQLEADDSPVPAFITAHFKHWLRKEGRLPKLSSEVQQQLAVALKLEEAVEEE